MKNAIYTTTVAATIAIAIASGNANAEGFSPWPDPSRVGTVQTTASETATPTSFYAAGLPQQSDRIDSEQAAVDVGPFYLASR